MKSKGSGTQIQPQPRRRLDRILYFLTVASFFLPFATVRSCVGDEGEGSSYTGFQIIAEDGGRLLVAVMVLAALLLALSFRSGSLTGIRQGMLSATEALLSAVAILTMFFATGLTFMFSRVSLQIGFYGCAGSWLLLHILNTRAALRNRAVARNGCREPPPPWGLAVGVLAAIVVAASVLISEPTGIAELLLGVFAGLLTGVPIVVMVMLLAVSYRLRRQKATEGD